MAEGNWMIVEAGGKQHLVTAGSRITTNRVTAEVGGTVEALNLIDNKPVALTVVAHTFGPKINGLKFKNKVRYLKRYGHRQQQSILEVAGAKTATAPAKPKPEAKTTKPKATAKKAGKAAQ